MTAAALWRWMMDGKYPGSYPGGSEYRTATAVLSRAIAVSKWNGHNTPDTHEVWPAGKRAKVVMASRLGDVGITDDLSAEHGYHFRTRCVEGGFGTVTVPPDDLLRDISPIETRNG